MTRPSGQSENRCEGWSSRDGSAPPIVVMSPPGRQAVWWVMAVLLAVIATALVMRWDANLLTRSALGQLGGTGGAQLGSGARGIYAFSGQLTSKSYGVFMLDVDTGTIWCYELSRGTNNELQMRLVAARSWVFDRYLEEFNAGEPIPAAVRAMVQRQRSHREPDAAGVGDAEGPNRSTQPHGDGSD